jgi:hypothetical protein
MRLACWCATPSPHAEERAQRAWLSCPGRVQRALGASGTRPGTQRKNREGATWFWLRSVVSLWVPGLVTLARDTRAWERAIPDGPHTASASCIRISRCQTAQSSSSRGACRRPGWSLSLRTRPNEGRAERRQAHLFCCRACEARLPRSVRRGASHDAGRSPLGAPPWRFSAGGRASISGIASGSVQRTPRSQVVMPGGRCPGPPEPAVTSRGRRTPLPAPPFRTVSGRRPSMSEDGNLLA